ncbi:23S rRNA (adenine(2030)-N(6))-methyltransferase RlmJ [Alteromonas pelagimontana]|uniref:Ribosomal RNA large subunit methyltransferase J n=1 Tax=Alteromonas pelagimontana TaxID=1858656 RepID=A0A6M4MHB4_9ALTE|nr:23S rRNA (adenine(2030)-N(6))-methyltransferase RlmJ [Alteromonas pelagimontana]QJR82594.1 23S rRNA (adenine(2030)-N(6))-methyltransferase RlmJ [Alteromonas pelagimontana]
MLSYQHGYHAGNHADVIKHLCWLGVINHLKRKNKPFTLFDTHAGAGLYPLDSEQAQKNKEFETGIHPLSGISANSELLATYLSLTQDFLAHQHYPGSPALAAAVMREQDIAHLMELHPGESNALNAAMRAVGKDKNVCVHHRDGLEGLIAMTPPQPNRGAVLIDPPYEQYREYQHIADTLEKMFHRWQNAQVVLWYPLLSARAGEKSGASEAMIKRIARLGTTAFSAELTVADYADDTGMYGSGVCVINPAWQLDKQLREALEEACAYLGEHTSYSLQWLKTEQGA